MDEISSSINSSQDISDNQTIISQGVASAPKQDISKSLIIMLVLVSVVISLLSTWVVLSKVNYVKAGMANTVAPVVSQSESTANVKFSIMPNPENSPTKYSQNAKVSFTIINKEGN